MKVNFLKKVDFSFRANRTISVSFVIFFRAYKQPFHV